MTRDEKNTMEPVGGKGLEAAAETGELAPEDFYLDGPYMVFTASYHTKRGYCCNSDCRHCPYR